MARFGAAPQGVHLVETSPALRSAQAARLPAAVHHDDIGDLPGDVAPIIVANEFFDALPIHQYVRTADGWRERIVARDHGALTMRAGDTSADEARSEERRVGKGCVSRCRTWWTPHYYKKKK